MKIQSESICSRFIITLLFVSFAALPIVRAVVPPPNGGYPGFNTAEATNALKDLSTGVGNTAAGCYSLFANNFGNYNIGVDAGALVLNNGNSNTAVGTAALLLNTDGSTNTAVDFKALLNNSTGVNNTATGYSALPSNTYDR